MIQIQRNALKFLTLRIPQNTFVSVVAVAVVVKAKFLLDWNQVGVIKEH
jgi:hypothetical protein